MSTAEIEIDKDIIYWAHDYWLGHCEGFRVESPSRRIGIVEAIVGDEDEPKALVVRGGVLGTRIRVVPIEAVASVEPRAERILLGVEPEFANLR